jgi:hypothetical protein
VTHFDSPGQTISPDLGSADIGIAQRWAALLTIETVTGNIWMLENADKTHRITAHPFANW